MLPRCYDTTMKTIALAILGLGASIGLNITLCILFK